MNGVDNVKERIDIINNTCNMIMKFIQDYINEINRVQLIQFKNSIELIFSEYFSTKLYYNRDAYYKINDFTINGLGYGYILTSCGHVALKNCNMKNLYEYPEQMRVD